MKSFYIFNSQIFFSVIHFFQKINKSDNNQIFSYHYLSDTLNKKSDESKSKYNTPRDSKYNKYNVYGLNY